MSSLTFALNRGIFFAVLLSLHPKCSGDGQERRNGSELRAGGTLLLESSRIIDVVDVRHRRRSDSRETFILEYLTELTIDEHEQLQREVESIWDVLPERTDLSQVEVVYIVAQNRATGESVQFVVERNEDGDWQKKGGFAYPGAERIDTVNDTLMVI